MNDIFRPIIEAFEFAFETLSPFFPLLLGLLCVRILISFFKHFILDVSSGSASCEESTSDDDNSDSKEVEQEKSIGFISVYSVLLDKEIFHWEGDYAKEIKKDRLTVYYTDNGINKNFSCDLDDHILVKEP